MIKKIYIYLSTHGVLLMVIGFITAIISLFILWQGQKNLYAPTVRHIAFECAVAGVVVYVIGRFFLEIERRRKRKAEAVKDLSDSKDDL
jgi:hypothetical protein